MAERKKIAAIVTTYFPASHADVIVTKFLKGFPTDEGLLPPQVEIVSMYLDQIHERDVGLRIAAEHGVPLYPSIRQALTLGGSELAVDGVLLIGEHGDYAWNEREQHLYPRRCFFEQICGVFATSGRSVPVFNDKHLSYNWADAKWMMDRAQELSVPFMAGSSVPLAWRNPLLEYPLHTHIDEAVVVSYGGLDSYGFHALELLQCMIERRAGGETGIAAITCLEGEDAWQTVSREDWLRDLTQLAAQQVSERKPGDMRSHCGSPALFLLEYMDGLHAAVLMLNGYLQGWGYAAQATAEIQSMEAILPGPPYPHFSYLSLNIQQMFLTGVPQYPVERTLLVSGALDSLMESRYRGHVRLETPHLDVVYQPVEKAPIRPSLPQPTGASLVPFEDSENAS